MKTQNISFGKKIPIATCQIKKMNTGKFIPAKIYSYDCKDKSDYIDIEQRAEGCWMFKDDIICAMNHKYHNSNSYSNSNFYTIEADDTILGLCRTDDYHDASYVKFIESKQTIPKEYQFIGQLLIAAAAKHAIQKRLKLAIDSPLRDAISFYENTCKFPTNECDIFEMNNLNMLMFLQRTKIRTKNGLKFDKKF